MSDNDNARRQAIAQYESIKEMVEALRRARDIDARQFDWEEEAARLGFSQVEKEDDGETVSVWRKDGVTSNAERYGATEDFEDAEDACRTCNKDGYPDEDEARQAIEEDALSVEVRSDWHSPGESGEATEYRVLLCTGGPAVQITGSLGRFNEPDDAEIEFQDWFTKWTPLRGEDAPDEEILLEYVRVFYFGEH